MSMYFPLPKLSVHEPVQYLVEQRAQHKHDADMFLRREITSNNLQSVGQAVASTKDGHNFLNATFPVAISRNPPTGGPGRQIHGKISPF